MTVRIGAACMVLAVVLMWPIVTRAAIPSALAPSWDVYLRTIKSGTIPEIVTAAHALPDSAKRAGIENAPELTFLLLRDAEALKARGEGAAAVEVAHAAQALSPTLGEPHRFFARALWEGHPADPLGSLREWGAAWAASLTEFWSWLSLADRLAAAVVLSILSVVLLTSAILTARSAPLVAHLVVEWSGYRLFPATAWLIAGWVLLVPFLTAVWAFWLVLLPSAIAWWFMTGRERVLVGVLAGAGLAMAAAFPAIVGVLMVDHDPELRLMAAVAQGEDTSPLLQQIQPSDETPAAVAAQALALVRGQREADAEALYEEALAAWPHDPRLLANYGTLFFRRQNYSRAIKLYEAALAAQPGSVVVLYNLSQAYRADLHFEEGEARFQEARALDAGLLDGYAERGRMGDAFLVVDYGFAAPELWNRALEPRAAPPVQAQLVERLRRHVSWSVTAGIAVVVGVCWVVGRIVPSGAAAPCGTCGTPVCRRCQRYFWDLKLCAACWKAYAKGVKLHPNTTLPQADHRWAELRRAAAALSIIPGAGHLAIGRPFWGGAFAFAAALFFWMGWLSMSGWLTLGERLFMPSWYLLWAPSVAGLTILYWVMIRHVLASEPPSSSRLPTGSRGRTMGRVR
ncbi:MAG: tetratricopeptide repeat protein [Nitrospirae bacterium]|nr:tetratricopeptide repeat protein [Nitrospirota bacterium]